MKYIVNVDNELVVETDDEAIASHAYFMQIRKHSRNLVDMENSTFCIEFIDNVKNKIIIDTIEIKDIKDEENSIG